MNRTSNLLLAAALGLAAIGGVIAVIQPGDMGDDDETASVTSPPDTSDTDTTESTDPEDDPVVGGDTTETTGAADDTSTSTTVAETTSSTTQTTAATTSTTAPADTGSGFDAEGAPSASDDALADTGGESMILAGAALAAVGITVRRRTA